MDKVLAKRDTTAEQNIQYVTAAKRIGERERESDAW